MENTSDPYSHYDYESEILDPYFPANIFSLSQLREGYVVVFVWGTCLALLGLVVAANMFLGPSLEVMASRLGISSEIADSVLLIAAYSLPKLLICLAGDLLAFNSIGPGLVIGSGVLNLTVVSGCCVRNSLTALQINGWHTVRDILAYSLVLALLIFFTMDNQVGSLEASMLIVVYIVYCLLIKFTSDLLFCKRKEDNQTDSPPINLENFERNETAQLPVEPSAGEHVVIESPTAMPDNKCQKMGFILMAPLLFPIWMTVPDMSKPSSQKWFVVTMIVSVVWLLLLFYPVVWWTTVVSETVSVPPEVLGLTVLAIAISVPDISRSISKSQTDLGGKAFLLCLRRNMFDLSFVLPLSWLLHNLIYGRYLYLYSFPCALLTHVLLLPLILLIALLSTRCSPIKCLLLFLLIIAYLITIFAIIAIYYGFLACPF